MSNAASLFQGQGSDGTFARAIDLPPHIQKRRVSQRRQMLLVQAASCSLNTLVLLIYCYAGTVSVEIPTIYFLAGIGLIGFFVVLSETHFNDRFEDHYLT